MRVRNQQAQEEDRVANVAFEERIQDLTGFAGLPPARKKEMRKEREEQQKQKRREEKKREEISLLDYIRETVELILDRHSDLHKNIPARLNVARLSDTAQNVVRYDMSRPHLIVKTAVTGRCKQCSSRSLYRCESCDVCLHADCFRDYHVA